MQDEIGSRRIRGIMMDSAARVSLFGDPEELRFSLRPWRTVGGEVRPTGLPLHAIDATLLDPWPALGAGSVVELTITGPVKRWPEWVTMTDFHGTAQDSELEAVRDALALRTLNAPPFGILTFDLGYGWYQGETHWRGQRVALTLDGGDQEDGQGALAAACALFADTEARAAAIEQAILAALLPLKNEVWLEEGEAPLTAAAFLARIVPESIGADADGWIDFSFGDGDLFWGHAIVARIDPGTGEIEASIAG